MRQRGDAFVIHFTGGLVEFAPGTRFCAKEHRARVDGRATPRHLHGNIERAVRCVTVKVSAESAGAVSVASNVFFDNPTKSLTTRQSGADSRNLMVVLAHLQQGVVATFRGQVGTTIVDHSMKLWAAHTPSLTSLPLTSPSPQRW